MVDRITFRRLVNTGQYEHLLVEWSVEVTEATADSFRHLVNNVDRCVELAKRKKDLEDELAETKTEIESVRKYAQLDSEERLGNLRVRVDTIRHDLDSMWDGAGTGAEP